MSPSEAVDGSSRPAVIVQFGGCCRQPGGTYQGMSALERTKVLSAVPAGYARWASSPSGCMVARGWERVVMRFVCACALGGLVAVRPGKSYSTVVLVGPPKRHKIDTTQTPSR